MNRLGSDTAATLILKRGEELHTSLTAYAKQVGTQSAWLGGLGGAMCVTLGFYDLNTKSYTWQDFNEPLEILSLTGNLSIVDDEPFWHVHGVFSGRDYRTIGGHIKELVIGLTGELVITPLPTPLTRLPDDETGLKLLDQLH